MKRHLCLTRFASPIPYNVVHRQFDILAKDTDTPMVRRAVASNVGNFAGVVEGSLLLGDVIPVFEALASDDQDNVRLLAVEQAGKVAKALVDQVSKLLLLFVIAVSTIDGFSRYGVLTVKHFMK